MVRRIIFAEDLSRDLVEIRGIACLQIPASLRTSKRPSDDNSFHWKGTTASPIPRSVPNNITQPFANIISLRSHIFSGGSMVGQLVTKCVAGGHTSVHWDLTTSKNLPTSK